MIERALVHVAGPRGAGKTTLVEALLRSRPGLVNVGRCVRDSRVRTVSETYPAGHPELKRYLRAGASRAALLRIPYADVTAGDTDFIYDTRLMGGMLRFSFWKRILSSDTGGLEGCTAARALEVLLDRVPLAGEGTALAGPYRAGRRRQPGGGFLGIATIEVRL